MNNKKNYNNNNNNNNNIKYNNNNNIIIQHASYSTPLYGPKLRGKKRSTYKVIIDIGLSL